MNTDSIEKKYESPTIEVIKVKISHLYQASFSLDSDVEDWTDDDDASGEVEF